MFDSLTDQLRQTGAIGVMLTDTVYGVVARAADQSAVARLYELKKRDAKPGTLIAANLEQLEELGFKHRYLKAVEQFWPGAVSVIIPAADPKLAYLHQSKMSLAVRIPDNKDLQNLLQQTGPLLTSSANQPAAPPATTIEQAQKYFGKEVDFYIDGGDVSGRQPSTIIRIIDDAIEVIRQGAVTIDGDTITS
ncbi:threonylcarbamoyl-AMP synthase [Candidatus Saccharibacteria bacterium CG_4_10_14_0_2_um_filter_52_9]|nr:MAG: threonylcarbamoyl-AMP synthase [Candidatus Saccharibacteria bacterium CG_4_10_14_0_2_um_filter_52_9]